MLTSLRIVLILIFLISLVPKETSKIEAFVLQTLDIIGQALNLTKDEQISSYDVAIQTYLGRTGFFQEIKDKFGSKFNITKYEYLDQTRGAWSRKYQEASKEFP